MFTFVPLMHWVNTRVNQSSIASLLIVQNAAAWLLTWTKKRDDISPVSAALHWLPIPYKVVLFVFLNRVASTYVEAMLNPSHRWS